MQHYPNFYLPLLILFPFFFPSLLANVFSSAATNSFLDSKCPAQCSLIFFILLVAIIPKATTFIDGSFRPFRKNALALAPSPRRRRNCSSSVSLRLQPIAASWSRLILLLVAQRLALSWVEGQRQQRTKLRIEQSLASYTSSLVPNLP